MTREAVVQKLRQTIGAEGQALLHEFNLLTPLIKQMVANEAIADIVVTPEQLEEARQGLLQQRGF